MKKLVVVKMGGSIITQKSTSTPKPNLKVINNIAKQIKYLWKEYTFILIHGAGSYGHPIAKKYHLNLGMQTDEQKLAFAQIHQSMLDLNKIIMDSLLQYDLPVVNFIPHSFIKKTAGQFKGMDTDLIKSCLDCNQIPILFGDTVYDDKWGCSILSGDTLVSYLSVVFKAESVIFLSDVEGIFDKNPKNHSDAKLIPLINNQNLNQIISGLSQSNHDDVTGEMNGKILSIKNHLTKTPVKIVSGLIDRNLIRTLQGKNAIGTTLVFD